MNTTDTGAPYSAARVRALMERYGLAPHKRWGQNFLIDRNSVEKIIDALPLDGQPRATVWEVGPGFGALTAALFERVAYMVLYEIDRALIVYLTERWPALKLMAAHDDAPTRPRAVLPRPRDAPPHPFAVLPHPLDASYLFPGDAVALLPIVLSRAPAPDILISNLPYRAAAPILLCCARSSNAPRTLAITVQREIGERIMATAGKQYSSFSVLMQLAYSVERHWPVPRTVFYPLPRVDSMFMILTAKKRGDADANADATADADANAVTANAPTASASSDVAAVEPLARSLFQSRRATVHKNLMQSPRYGASYRRLLDRAPHNPLIRHARQQRAEQLPPEHFQQLARLLREHEATPKPSAAKRDQNQERTPER